MTTVVTRGEDETRSAGSAFAHELRPGDVVALTGDLGAGKTRFVQGVCTGLGIEGHVASPTFTLVHEYVSGALTVFHFDCYRIRSINEMIELGFEDYLRADAICLIEWSEKITQLLPADRIDVAIRLGAGETDREITIRRYGRN